MRAKYIAVFILFALTIQAPAGEDLPLILPMKERAVVMNRWLEHRLETLLPELMRREGIEMWILIAGDENVDPVLATMLPAEWIFAPRRTILVFYNRGKEEGIERLAISVYRMGGLFETVGYGREQHDQWRALAEVIENRNPRNIALNYSADFPLSDGLTYSQYQQFLGFLPEAYANRIVSAERLAVGWLETRTRDEMLVYPQLVRIAHLIIAEGLSEKNITPGVTTLADVQMWYWQRIRSLGLTTWFCPIVNVQRAGEITHRADALFQPVPEVIIPGDLVHVDFGINYLGLKTDTQQQAYVLKPGEADAPEGLNQALAIGNRLQDIFLAEFKTGRTGNEVLKATREKAEAEGINGLIYTHPLGYHGHAAGPTIGLSDHQEGIPGAGDYPLYPNTVYAIELSVSERIPEWGNKLIRIALEEDAFFDGEKVWFIDGRQTKLILIPSSREAHHLGK